MGQNIKEFISSFSGTFDISGNKTKIKLKAKKAGTYSKQVSTDTTYNLSKSNVKIANIVRDELAVF
jgi:hypothetical protein